MLLELWAKEMMFLCHFDAGFIGADVILNNDIYYEL